MTPTAKKTSSKASKKSTQKKSTSAKGDLPIPPAPKKKTKKKTSSKKKYTNLSGDEKAEIAARNLLRLYQFLQMNKPITELTLLQELELDTPSEILRQEILQVRLDIESVHEENHALQQTALRTQVEAEEQVEAVTNINLDLKKKIKEMNDVIQKELEKRGNDFELVIGELRKKLKQSISQNEKYTEVTEGIKQLQNQVTTLFDQNEELLNEKNSLNKTIDQLKKEAEERDELIKAMEKKSAELLKKTELQKMVIDGYKRKEQQG
ncbi:MAG: hypothetical protein ACTSYI_14095 [Promethearchaeota archaeon]